MLVVQDFVLDLGNLVCKYCIKGAREKVWPLERSSPGAWMSPSRAGPPGNPLLNLSCKKNNFCVSLRLIKLIEIALVRWIKCKWQRYYLRLQFRRQPVPCQTKGKSNRLFPKERANRIEFALSKIPHMQTKLRFRTIEKHNIINTI